MTRKIFIALLLIAVAAPSAAFEYELQSQVVTGYNVNSASNTPPTGNGIANRAGEARLPLGVSTPSGTHDSRTGTFFLKNTNAPGSYHPGSVQFLMNDGSVRSPTHGPARVAGVPATPGARTPVLHSPEGLSRLSVAPMRPGR